MKVTFTQTTPRPPRPPVVLRGLHHILTILFILLLPAMSAAQVNCFSGFNAGDNTTYCEGESATLDGGYDFYDEIGAPDVGTPSLVWIVAPGSDGGTFTFDGVSGASATNINFNNSENSITGFPDVTFTPDPGVTVVTLRLQGFTSAGPCSGVVEIEEVTLYFDPIQDTPIDALLEVPLTPDVTLDDALGAGNTLTSPTGGVLSLTIDEGFIIDNGQQNDDIRRYEVSYSGTGGFLGLPSAGSYTQNEFETMFDNLTLTSISCDPATITLSIRAYYDRDNNIELGGAEECPGPITELAITVDPRPEAQATIGTNVLTEICDDDQNKVITVTGTPFTEVSWTLDLGNGSVAQPPITIDGTGVNNDIIVDATQLVAGETITVTLTGASFVDAPACPVTFTKPIVLTVISPPILSIDFLDPDDEVLCNFLNGGPNIVPFVFRTTGPPGVYDYDVELIANGNSFGIQSRSDFFADLGDGTVGIQINLNSASLTTGTVMTYRIIGDSFTPDNDGNPETAECGSPLNAEVSFLVQKESYVVVQTFDNTGASVILSNYSNSAAGDVATADLTFCDGESFDLNIRELNQAFADIVGSEALLEVSIGDNDGLISAGGASVGIFNGTDNPFSISEVLEIPNSQTTNSFFNIAFQPFMDNDGDGIFSDGDCQGELLLVNVTVRPAPTVSVEVSDDIVCDGDNVTVTITASEPGTANLIINNGGAPISVPVEAANGAFVGTWTSPALTAMTQFTVTTFLGDVADCAATVNQMVMTDIELIPDGTISGNGPLCAGEEPVITFTGSGGNGTGYTFTYSIDGSGPLTATAAPGETTATVTLGVPSESGSFDVTLISVANTGGLGCTSFPDLDITFDVEELPVVTCTAEEEFICSGDSWQFNLAAGSPDPSAIGSTLYYYVEITDNTSGAPVVAAPEIFDGTTLSIGGGPVENMTGFDQTIDVTVTPFYFDGTPELSDFADACQGEPSECSVTVRTMPMSTFGGNATVCRGDTYTLTFTGPPNGSARVRRVRPNGTLTGGGIVDFDGGGSATVTLDTDGGPLSQTTTFRLTEVTDENGCISDAFFEVTVIVIPDPEGSFDGADEDTVCEESGTTVNLTGTPGATITVSANGIIDNEDFDIDLDVNGEGSFETGPLSETTTYEIVFVSVTNEGANGTVICFGEPGDEITITVDPAPTGALVSNRILCAGDEPVIQFNATTGDGYAGTYDITVVNDATGESYDFTVSDGEALVFDPAITLDVTTTFSLPSIQRNSDPACSNLVPGVSTDVIVNDVPEVTIASIPTGPVCSGDLIDLIANATPADLMSEDGNPLFYEIILTDAEGPAGAPQTFRIPASADLDLNAELGFDNPFINASTTINDRYAFTVTPYYETEPDNPAGVTECIDGFGLPLDGFTGDFAEANWVTEAATTDGGVVLFSSTDLGLVLPETDFDGIPGDPDDDFDVAAATYTFTEGGRVSFDYAIALLDNIPVPFTRRLLDVFVINFEGEVVVLSTAILDIGSFSSVVVPGSDLTVGIGDFRRAEQRFISSALITNFVFEPDCQPCPGETLDVEFEILPALFADWDPDNPARVCEGEDAELCIVGTPEATVSVFLGGGVFVDVKLDAEGNGCFTTVGGLFEDSDFIITGLTTLESDPECSYTYPPAERPTATVFVTPAPTASVEIDPSIICSGEAATADISSNSPFATVTYQIDNGGDETILLDENGEASIPLATVNEGVSNIDVVVTISSISTLEEDGVVCTADLNGNATLTIRPLPRGTITAGNPACFGGSVPVVFNATTVALNDYTLEIDGPGGVEVFTGVKDGDVVFMADVEGTYTLISIEDGTGRGIGCSNTASDETLVIIEDVPSLAAAISGTVGTANIDNLDPILNSFTAVACDEATIETIFSSTTLTSDPAGDNDPLWVEVQVTNNDGLMLGLPAGPTTFVVPFGELTFEGILANLDDLAPVNITVALTPYFENGDDTAALNNEECEGPSLNFNITILPEVTFDFDGGDTEVCEGDPITINLAGSPGATVVFTSSNIDLDPASAGGEVILDGAGAGAITGTAITKGTASVNVSMVHVTTIIGNISRQCMIMPDADYDIVVNENPLATISLEPEGPICNGETVDVIATLFDTDFDAGDSFTFVVDGISYSATVDGTGKATLFTSAPLTVMTTFTLTSVTNDVTGCSTDLTDDDVTATVMVEEVPDGVVEVTIDGVTTSVPGGSAGSYAICANERIDLAAFNTNGTTGSFMGELTASDPNFIRPNSGSNPVSCSTSGFNVLYDTYDFTIDAADTYTFVMNGAEGVDFVDAWLALYEGGFDPGDVCTNILASNDDNFDDPVSILNSQIVITLTLVPGDYTLVASSFCCLEEGDYAIAYGSAGTGSILGLPGESMSGGNSPLVGEDYVSVDFSISEDIDFYGLGQSGTIAMPIGDFADQFSREYNMIFGAPVNITLDVTYYNETDPGEGAELNDGECVGTTSTINITINPNPKTQDITAMVCSGEDLVVDLDDAITNGLVGATYSYTVTSDAAQAQPDLADRPVASSDDVLANFINTGDESYEVVYTVTPFGAEGCQGNDFTLTVTVKPEPVITAGQEITVCSGDATGWNILLDNNPAGSETFTLVAIDPDTDSGTFVADAGNADVGDSGNFGLIAGDVFTNTGSTPVLVTYTLRPTSAAGCVGEDVTIEVTVLPEPVVADFMLKVCSGGSIDLGFDDLTANGVGDVLRFTRSALALTTLRVFDENGTDVTIPTWQGNSQSNPGISRIQDSYLNQGTATLSVFYDVEIAVMNGEGECDAATFLLEVKVVEEADVILEPLNGATAICEGDPITLVATYDGSGNVQGYEYSYTSDDDVVLDLTPSAAGGEVTVNAVSGSGLATVMVMVTDDNSCVAMATRVVSVGESPAAPVISGSESPCADVVSFYSVDPAAGNTIEWSIGNPALASFTGGITTEPTISITFTSAAAGTTQTISVTETTPTGCSTTTEIAVSVATELTANFIATPVEGDPLTFEFTSLSAGNVQSLEWDFGDGSPTSSEAVVLHTFPDNPTNPGNPFSYDVTLTAAGTCAPFVSTAAQTVVINDNSVCDEIPLAAGLNFVSFDVAPTDNAFQSILSGVIGLVSVSGIENGSGVAYNPLFPQFSSLQTAKPGHGYLITVTQAQTLMVCGTPISDNYQIDLAPGANFVAYLPQASQGALPYFQPMMDDGVLVVAQTFGNNVTPNEQLFLPAFPQFSSLQTMLNGIGYSVIVNAAVGGTGNPLAAIEPTSVHDFVFGTVSGDGYDQGTLIEILDGHDQVIGYLQPDADGNFKASPVYGTVDLVDGTLMEAMEVGDEVRLRYNGEVINTGLDFNGNYGQHRLDVVIGEETPPVTYEELTVSVYPNPVLEIGKVDVDLPAAALITVVVLDASGRQVQQIVRERALPAGRTTINWNEVEQLSSGVYYLTVIRDGKVVPGATQQVIKQ